MSKDFKEIYLPIIVFFLAVVGFIYINYVEPSESVEKKIALKQSHDPQIKVDTTKPVPKLKINLAEDKKSGVNIKVDFENFILTPQNVSEDDRPNEGHMHLYVNGYKVARVYSEWFHIDVSYLDLGENEITVTLNANDHSAWTSSSGELIKDTVKYIKKIN